MSKWIPIDEALNSDDLYERRETLSAFWPSPGSAWPHIRGSVSTPLGVIACPLETGLNDSMRGGSPASEGPVAHTHGIRVARNVTDTEPITLEEYRRRG